MPNDVLLYRGTSPISRAILLLDGTQVIHAGLCLESQSLFDQFFTTVADFVTPGDLLKTPSLTTWGEL